MSKAQKAIRQSVSLPPKLARDVRAMARARKTSANRVLVDLIEAGFASKAAEKKQFFALANQLGESTDPRESERIKKQLAHMTFGE